MKRVYLAAPFEWLEKCRKYATDLQALGIEVTSKWHTEQALGGDTDLTAEEGATKVEGHEDQLRGYACRDIRDSLAADTIVEFNPGKALVRNTRVAELGGALFTGRQVISIGPENPKKRSHIDNAFVILDRLPPDLLLAGIKPVIHYHTWEEFLAAVAALNTSRPE
jgi:hypothetical protein